MKVSLVVLTAGKTAGKAIPITLSQFIIGRDPQCNLRPASAMISKRHCAILIKDGLVALRDFDSTNGTFVNDKQVRGQVLLKQDDVLKVGPLTFKVAIEGAPRPTPAPKTKKPAAAGAPAEEESAADLLLGLDDEPDASSAADESAIPGGSTIMESVPLPPDTSGATDQTSQTSQTMQDLPALGAQPDVAKGDASKGDGKDDARPGEKKEDEKGKIPVGTARDAARAILERYNKGRRR